MASINNYRYASGYTDGTGLIKFGARYHNPTLARFTQPDPSGQETNNYTYTGDNPISRTDPTGEWSLLQGLNDLAGVVVGVAAYTACTTVTEGAGAIACGIGAGAVGALTTDFLNDFDEDYE